MITRIYILESDNRPIIQYKKNGEKNTDDNLLLRLAKSLQQFANGMEEDLNDFVIGDKKYFFAKNAMSGTQYIIETEAEVKRKQVYPILRKIQNLYMNEFIGSMTMSQKEIEKAKGRIKEQIASSLVDSNMRVEDFLKTI
ncbi:MAG: hypothetical protein BAJALOKI3v1_70089 [Promethearchaeota archaeon]|jgi:uncharacterized protein with von Willebrand factor type A (vWA) domain|nr:MAG: hypothetical protein BAJALOKI3v1_70089 [Candidatus Lokiarchaeota archaeon]